jgi:hypothetical protein
MSNTFATPFDISLFFCHKLRLLTILFVGDALHPPFTMTHLPCQQQGILFMNALFPFSGRITHHATRALITLPTIFIYLLPSYLVQ